jgi:hypothetical protein
MSLLGLGLAFAGAVIALWWAPAGQIDLSLLRFPASFLNYQHANRPTALQVAQTVVPVSTVVVRAPATATAQAAATSAPAILRTAADERWRIAKTDGLGVVLRSAARLNAREPRGLEEGTLVSVLEREGLDWVRVRSTAGQEGWVPAQYVLPQE